MFPTIPVANLPLVLLIVVAICRWYQQHQQHRWQNLLPVKLMPMAAKLPLVELISVVHLDLLREFLNFFKMTLNLFSGA
jgi:hypothetical protein